MILTQHDTDVKQQLAHTDDLFAVYQELHERVLAQVMEHAEDDEMFNGFCEATIPESKPDERYVPVPIWDRIVTLCAFANKHQMNVTKVN